MTKRKPGAIAARSWTDDETDQLRALCAEGLRSCEIGRRLGRTRSAVASRRRLLGLLQTPEQRRANIGIGLREKVSPAARKENCRKAGASGWTPERRAADAQRKRDLGLYLIGHKHITPDVIAKRVANRTETLFGWCPVEYRALRRELVKVKKLTRAEAEAVVRDVIARDAARAATSEAQRIADEAARNGWSVAFQMRLERVQAGDMTITERAPMRTADPTFSPIGSTLGNI